MQNRRMKLEKGGFYHVFNKSIAGYKIFKDISNGQRFLRALYHYNVSDLTQSLSSYLYKQNATSLELPNILIPRENAFIKFLSYCIMPDHYHLIVKILVDDIFSKYINDIENSFSRFFNTKFKRKGPIWQHRFKSVRISRNSQLLHTTRYVNINPTTSSLVEKPEDWILSSYRDLIDENQDILGKYLSEISIGKPNEYKIFCENNIDYQRKLKMIKKIIIE